MIRQCPGCKRANPNEAVFCYYDGKPLANGAADATIDFSKRAFPHPFVFANGARCDNFLQLALACKRHPQEAVAALRGGFLGAFFGSLGRVDLALAAKALAGTPDDDRALDELFGKLPGSPLAPAQLVVEPLVKNLGTLHVGDDRTFDLQLTNKGDRLIHGKASVGDCPWLVLGDTGTPEKLLQFFDSCTLHVRVPGKRLRAFEKQQRGEINIETTGGALLVAVEVTVPAKPFPDGPLAGATTPREFASKAKAQPREAAALIESGAVARWYESNGWTYPVQGPTASGLAAVQQLFEMLGLVKPPKVELAESSVTLKGKAGQRLEATLSVSTQEKRAAVAHAASDQPWLTFGKTAFRGQSASIPLIVEAVPQQPGQTLTANAKVSANGNQRFDVPVTLHIADGPGLPPPPPGRGLHAPPPPPPPPVTRGPAPQNDILPNGMTTLGAASEPSPFQFDSPVAVQASPFSFAAPPAPSIPPPPPAPASFTAPALDRPTPVTAPPPAAGGKQWLFRLLPLGIIAAGLLTAVIHDMTPREAADEPLPPIDYANPVLDLRFHDAVIAGDFVTKPSMCFGLGVPDKEHPGKFKTKLTYDDLGRTSNVCVRIDQRLEYLFGINEGVWRVPMKEPLGTDQQGNRLIGARSVWMRPGQPKVNITQIVEIVPAGLSPDSKKRLLDTCLVRYDITNEDTLPHKVALRFMLDTFIGNNDAVPFTIAGQKELCSTMKSFDKAEDVPDYISALEKQDLKNPGTVAHLSLKYGAPLEPPSRVTLGAWPATSVRKAINDDRAQMHNTMWEVPVASMRLATSAENPGGDSAVTMYWNDKEIAPRQTRTVGFAYGLGSVTGDKGEGQLGITAGGELVADREFTLTAYVKNPAPGTTITLELPKRLKLAGGKEKEDVPPIPPGAASPYSPVTWRIKATKGGVHKVTVTLNTGATSSHKLVVKPADFLK